jgi:transposase
LKAIFEHIGGVPPRIWFDNASTIVAKVIKGGGRNLTDDFMRFMVNIPRWRSHLIF